MGAIKSQLLLGGQCLACGAPLTGPDPVWRVICVHCVAQLPWITEERCEVCSLPLVSEHVRCVRCRLRGFAFSRHRALFLYADLPALLVHAFKFGQRRSLGEPFARALADAAFPAPHDIDLLVPVPGNPRRARVRGWSPTEVLCSALSRILHLPHVRMIARTAGGDQKELSYDERISTVSRRYTLRGRSCKQLPGARICLVDDVFTTGATVSACAEILKRAGAGTVSAVTLAID